MRLLTQALDRLEEVLITGMLAAMTLLTFVQVVLRYVFNSGFTWALELTSIFFSVMIFAGMAYGIRIGAHIGVDALVKLMPRRLHRAISIVVVLLCLVYAGMVFAGSYEYVSTMRMIGVEIEDLPIPVWIVRSVVPIGCALLFLRLSQVLWRLLTGQTDSLHLGDEAADAMKLKAEETDKEIAA